MLLNLFSICLLLESENCVEVSSGRWLNPKNVKIPLATNQKESVTSLHMKNRYIENVSGIVLFTKQKCQHHKLAVTLLGKRGL